MPKILVGKQKKTYVEELERELTLAKQKFYFIGDTTRDFHCTEGIISKKDLAKKDGSVMKSSQGREFVLFSPSFIDFYFRISRGAQIIPLKDVGYIIARTGINKESKVLDAGSGSGALSCAIAGIAREVYTYEIREDHIKIVRENIEYLGLKNLKSELGDIYKGIKEKNFDTAVLDLPEPWKALPALKKALKIGAFFVSYSPSITQSADMVNAVLKSDEFIHIETVEIILRSWEIDGRKVRPSTKGIGHSGFLSFCRKIK
jgi:tRNA (adenine57-N1/adenine58-N1)-methyltransferase catalytic subunit